MAWKTKDSSPSHVFSVVVILNHGDKVVRINRRGTGYLAPLTPKRAAARPSFQETATESEAPGLHELLSGDTEQAACWAAEFLQMEEKKLWTNVSHGTHGGWSLFKTSLWGTEMPGVRRSHLGACQHSPSSELLEDQWLELGRTTHCGDKDLWCNLTKDSPACGRHWEERIKAMGKSKSC